MSENQFQKIIAVDFDGCLCEKDWPNIGAPRVQVITELIRRKAGGAKIILWSCREGQQLEDAVAWCLERGLVFDAVNDNLAENVEYFQNNSRKVYAHEYWDDRSVIVFGSGENVGLASATQEGGLDLTRWGVKTVETKMKKRWWERFFGG